MVRALRRAHHLLNKHYLTPGADPFGNLAAKSINDSFERRIARLAFLAPDIQAAIVEGRHPAGLTLQGLMRAPLPISWAAQRAALGFA